MPLIEVNNPPPEVYFGIAGEANPRTFFFDVTKWKILFPAGLVTIEFRRPDANDATVCVADSPDNPVIWQPSTDDMSVGGVGEIILLMYYNSAPAKSLSISTHASVQTSTTISVNTDANPILGTLATGHEYRCTNLNLTDAPAMTIPAIPSTASEFSCAVIFKAPNTTVPTVTNNSGYSLKYSGTDVSNGAWTPVADTVYRMNIVFDGIYVNIRIL